MAQIGIDREGFRPSYRPSKPASAGAMDPDMKRMGVVAAGIGGVIALLVGGSMLIGPRHHGVPVIEAVAGPVRIKPQDAGGMKVTGADFGLGTGTTQTLAPAAEQPQINALKAQLHAVEKKLAAQAAQTAQVAKQEAATAQVAKLAEATSSKIAAAPPVERASATARIVALAPTPAAKPVVKLPAAGASVQLAAFTDEAAAHTGWETLVKKSPDLLGGREPEISKAQAAGRTMWRLRTGGFATVAEATSFCAKMRAHGADCSIAAF